jgi:hypothetical protein
MAEIFIPICNSARVPSYTIRYVEIKLPSSKTMVLCVIATRNHSTNTNPPLLYSHNTATRRLWKHIHTGVSVSEIGSHIKPIIPTIIHEGYIAISPFLIQNATQNAATQPQATPPKNHISHRHGEQWSGQTVKGNQKQ